MPTLSVTGLGWGLGGGGGASGQEPCSHLEGQAVPSGGLLGKKAHGGGGWGDRSEVLGVGLGKGATPTLLISLCRSLVTISSKTSPSPLMSLGMRVGRLSLRGQSTRIRSTGRECQASGPTTP